VLDDGLLQVDEVRGLERVRLVVRERAVELEVERDDLERQLGQPGCGAEHGGRRETGHAVAGIHDDLDGADAVERHERAKVRGIVGEHILLAEAARGVDRGDAARQVRLGAIPDGAQAGVEADSPRARAAELDAVVDGGVVARGEHGGRGIQNA
jgi:hypothetical protein